MSLLSRCNVNISVNQIRSVYGRCRIGFRDVVGYGINGSYNYMDNPHFPFPAIRFMENTTDILINNTWPAGIDHLLQALRQKERGDWKLLCCEEKKALYRASFCQTFAEFQHPTGTWKFILGIAFVFFSFPFWAAMFMHHYVYDPLPDSYSDESQRAQLRRMLELRVNPIDGLSSKWDYDNDRWK